MASIRAFASKSPEHILRIAAILAFLENVGTLVIQQAHIEAATELIGFYMAEALRMKDTSAMHPDKILTNKVLAWFISTQKQTITLQELYQGGPREVRDAQTAKRILSLLEQHYWVFQTAENVAAWRIHSNLFMF